MGSAHAELRPVTNGGDGGGVTREMVKSECLAFSERSTKSNNDSVAVVALSLTCTSLAVTLFRLWDRKRHGRMWWDDYWAAFGMIFLSSWTAAIWIYTDPGMHHKSIEIARYLNLTIHLFVVPPAPSVATALFYWCEVALPNISACLTRYSTVQGKHHVLRCRLVISNFHRLHHHSVPLWTSTPTLRHSCCSVWGHLGGSLCPDILGVRRQPFVEA